MWWVVHGCLISQPLPLLLPSWERPTSKTSQKWSSSFDCYCCYASCSSCINILIRRFNSIMKISWPSPLPQTKQRWEEEWPKTLFPGILSYACRKWHVKQCIMSEKLKALTTCFPGNFDNAPVYWNWKYSFENHYILQSERFSCTLFVKPIIQNWIKPCKVKSTGPLVGYTAGAHPCFNDVKRLRSCHSPLSRAPYGWY